MKALMCVAAALALSLSACTTTTGTSTNNGVGTATNVGMTIFKVAVDHQCRTELNSSKAWRILALTMSAEQQSAVENKICGCVSEKAPQSVTVVEVAQAAIDPNARVQIVANAVSKTLTACYAEFARK